MLIINACLCLSPPYISAFCYKYVGKITFCNHISNILLKLGGSTTFDGPINPSPSHVNIRVIPPTVRHCNNRPRKKRNYLYMNEWVLPLAQKYKAPRTRATPVGTCLMSHSCQVSFLYVKGGCYRIRALHSPKSEPSQTVTCT